MRGLADVGNTSECSPEMNAHLEGSLSTEASMIVLDTLELIVQVLRLGNFLYFFGTGVALLVKK